MLQRFEAILLFYKPYAVWSFAVNILNVIFGPNLATAIFSKLILTLFLYYVINETNGQQKLIFYKNLGISSLRLFSSLFIIDIIITITFIVIMQEFI